MLTPGGRIGIGRATRGLVTGRPDQGEFRITLGFVGSLPVYETPAIEILPITPTPAQTDTSRSTRFIFTVRDGNVALELSTLSVRYRQQPYPAESADGWVQVMNALTFEAGFDGIGSTYHIGPYEDGQRITVSIQPLFGLLPAGTGTIRVTIEDSVGVEYYEEWSFTSADDALSANLRDRFYTFRRQAERYGWEALLIAAQTYNFDPDPNITGGAISVDLNTSLAADFGDQMSESPFGLGVLNNVRRIRLLAKSTEYARDSADPDAMVLFDDYVSESHPVFADRRIPGAQNHQNFTDEDLLERQFRYYTLFILVPPQDDSADWYWGYADNATFAKAFPYGRYGHQQKLYDMMPESWQLIDGEIS